jgi:hypothetical protein
VGWNNPFKAKVVSLTAPKIVWPTDAYDSVRFLFGMYVKKTHPFSDWRTARANLASAIEELAETSVTGYQLLLWFVLYGKRHGSIESLMLKDAFCHLFSELDSASDMESQVHWMLNFQEEAINYYINLGDDKKKSMVNGKELELPQEYFIASYHLLGFPDSPYANGNVPLDGQEGQLAMCLAQGRFSMQSIFIPMQEAVQTFDAAKIPFWKWTVAIGAHERHLQRRHNNPLFEPSRRIVTGADVYNARLKDSMARADLIRDLDALRTELRVTELPPTWFDYLNKMRVRAEAIVTRIAMQGRAAADQKARADQTRAYIVGIMRDALATTGEDQVVGIDAAEKLYASSQNMASIEWRNQVRHPEKIVPPQEVIAALLCEDLNSLRAIVNEMETQPTFREALANARTGALDIVRPAVATGCNIPEIKEKLAILGVSL